MKVITISQHAIILATWLVMATCAIGAQAQRVPYVVVTTSDYTRENNERCCQQIDEMMSTRTLPRQVMSLKSHLLNDGCETHWTDGSMLYIFSYDNEEHQVGMYMRHILYYNDLPPVDGALFNEHRGVVTPEDNKQHKLSIESIGGHTMLVLRDAQGQPLKSLYHVPQMDPDQELGAKYFPMMLMGEYVTDDDKHVVFGPRMDWYGGKSYEEDPGVINGFYINPETHAIHILYGDRRVSRGRNMNTKGNEGIRMPGEGGAGAIMGPMEWALYPTVDGLTVIITHDEKYVDHMPRIGEEGDTIRLTKLQTPFQGLDGKWAFASVLPLSHTMLDPFPKEVLTLMRGEIYARHGDTFKDPATQRYFDQQPWYHRSNTPVKLTDLERFNYQLIKQVEATR